MAAADLWSPWTIASPEQCCGCRCSGQSQLQQRPLRTEQRSTEWLRPGCSCSRQKSLTIKHVCYLPQPPQLNTVMLVVALHCNIWVLHNLSADFVAKYRVHFFWQSKKHEKSVFQMRAKELTLWVMWWMEWPDSALPNRWPSPCAWLPTPPSCFSGCLQDRPAAEIWHHLPHRSCHNDKDNSRCAWIAMKLRSSIKI